jgi:hypothetical protein
VYTYKLLLEGDLLKLHLVHAGGLGGAEQRRGCEKSALHDGQK